MVGTGKHLALSQDSWTTCMLGLYIVTLNQIFYTQPLNSVNKYRYIFSLVLVSHPVLCYTFWKISKQNTVICTFTLKGINIFVSNFPIHRAWECHLHFLLVVHGTVMLEMGWNLFLYVTIHNKVVLIWTSLAWLTTPCRHTWQEVFVCWTCTSRWNGELIFKYIRGCCFHIMWWMGWVVFVVIKIKYFLAFFESIVGILLRERKNLTEIIIYMNVPLDSHASENMEYVFVHESKYNIILTRVYSRCICNVSGDMFYWWNLRAQCFGSIQINWHFSFP